jgi:hypothetical protein
MPTISTRAPNVITDIGCRFRPKSDVNPCANMTYCDIASNAASLPARDKIATADPLFAFPARLSPLGPTC